LTVFFWKVYDEAMTTAAQYFKNLSSLFEVWRSFYAQKGTYVRLI